MTGRTDGNDNGDIRLRDLYVKFKNARAFTIHDRDLRLDDKKGDLVNFDNFILCLWAIWT